MKRNYLLTATFTGAILFTIACKKDIPDLENTYPGNTHSNGAMNAYFQQIAPSTQTFTVDASNGGYFTGTEGTMIAFGPGAFLYSNGQPVSGNVTVELIEVFSKKAIIATGGFTMADGVPINSDGEVNITAWQGSQELVLAGAGSMTVGIPAGTNPDFTMDLFVAPTIGAGRDFDLDTVGLTVVQDSAPGPAGPTYYYYAYPSTLGWTNIDQYMSGASDLTPYSVSLPLIFNDTNTVVIFSLNDYNSVGSIYGYYFDEPTNTFTSGPYYQMPVGFDVTFIAISEINGQFYYAEQQLIVGQTCAISLIPQICTQAYIDQKLNSL